MYLHYRGRKIISLNLQGEEVGFEILKYKSKEFDIFFIYVYKFLKEFNVWKFFYMR